MNTATSTGIMFAAGSSAATGAITGNTFVQHTIDSRLFLAAHALNALIAKYDYDPAKDGSKRQFMSELATAARFYADDMLDELEKNPRPKFTPAPFGC